MTTAQLLRRLKSLPKKEQALIVRELEREGGRRRRSPVRTTWPDVEARARQIASGRLLPNLVLLERGEEPF